MFVLLFYKSFFSLYLTEIFIHKYNAPINTILLFKSIICITISTVIINYITFFIYLTLFPSITGDKNVYN